MTTIGIEELDALEKRVQEATGPDRELDAALEVVARTSEAARSGLPPEHWAKWRAGPGGHVGDDHTAYYAEPYTTSLDAALALVERCLPGWRVVLDSDHDRGPPWGAMVRPSGQDWPPRSFAPTPALALLSALIAALRAKAGA